MEPNLPMPHGSPEMGPPIERPELPGRQSGEILRVPERQEIHEQKAGAMNGPAPAYATPVIPTIPAMPDPVAQVQKSVIDDNPAVAADDDVIEKEWVEKAKKVISETKHDPYLQEQAVSRLQADYLQKRYGKTVKLPEEG